MGKYIRKPKTTRDVAVKDVSQSSLGVRTRARTLALQRLQSSASASAADDDDETSPPETPKPDFLELRSRRLEKPPLVRKNCSNSRKTPPPKQGFVRRGSESPQFESSTEKSCSGPVGFPIDPAEDGDGRHERLNGGGFEIGDSEVEASFGENNLELEAMENNLELEAVENDLELEAMENNLELEARDSERGTRESTPCSFIRPANSVTTPGSSTRPTSPTVANQMAQNAAGYNPTASEMDEFFAQVEKPHQRRFIEKYNFDIVNDMPLPGRYEWVKVMP